MPDARVLVTGVTGFVGKVVLEELVRRHEALGIDRVVVVIRPQRGRGAQERFEHDVAPSPCFSRLPPGWTSRVDVVEASLEDAARLEEQLPKLAGVTHIIHAAASISFDLPMDEAARSNIDTALNVLGLATRLPRLRRMVAVSTAYVTPHVKAGGPVPEALTSLPAPATDLMSAIRDGVPEEHLLGEAGLPNTYTYTKALAEHLLAERRGDVPLTILRPSVISASRRHPFPGWIDSAAGFAGFVAMLGMGYLRAVVAHGDSKVDLVPVDDVADHALRACFEDEEPFAIRHATAGAERSPSLHDCWQVIEDFYRHNRVHRRPALRYMGPRRMRFHIADALHHGLPVALASVGPGRRRRRARRLRRRLAQLNRAFPYFTSNSFDFVTSRPLPDSFSPQAYLQSACEGIHRHILKQDRTQWMLAGARKNGRGDLAWALQKPHGNAWIRFAGWQARKTMRRIFDEVTVDLPSFEAARAEVPKGAAIVVVGSHRSYLDFVLLSYLAFARPDLRIAIPHIAATMEFAKIPVLGRVLASMHAFYVRRGVGHEDPELNERIRGFLDEGKTLEFFIEGTRSRAREFLAPKRGLLRALQGTGQPVAILPVSLCYDRVPEESAFAKELAGQPKPKMRLSAFLRWSWRARRGKVALGRAHIACAPPVMLDARADVHEVAEGVVDGLRDAMATTTFHVDAYLRHHPVAEREALFEAIEASGGRVLISTLPVPEDLDPHIAETMWNQFGYRIATAKMRGAEQAPLLLARGPARRGRVGHKD